MLSPPEAASKEFTRHPKKKASFFNLFFFPTYGVGFKNSLSLHKRERKKTHIVGESPVLPNSLTHVGQGREQQWDRQGMKCFFMCWPGWGGCTGMEMERSSLIAAQREGFSFWGSWRGNKEEDLGSKGADGPWEHSRTSLGSSTLPGHRGKEQRWGWLRGERREK